MTAWAPPRYAHRVSWRTSIVAAVSALATVAAVGVAIATARADADSGRADQPPEVGVTTYEPIPVGGSIPVDQLTQP